MKKKSNTNYIKKTVKESMYRQQFGTDPNLSHTP